MANAFDIILAVLLLLFTVRGLVRGLIKELAGFIGLLLGFFTAARYYPLVIPYIAKVLDDTTAINVLSYIAVFMAVLLVVKIFSVGIEKFMSVTSIGWLNHLLGGGIGAAKGTLLCIVTVTLVTYLIGDEPTLKNSLLAPHFDEIATWGRKFLPPLLDNMGNTVHKTSFLLPK